MNDAGAAIVARGVSLGDASKTNGAAVGCADAVNCQLVALSSWGAFIQEVAGMESQDREATALYCPLTAIQGRHQIDPGLKGGCDG